MLAEQLAAPVMHQMGDRIRTFRAERQLTLRALAELTKLSPQMLSQVERGTTNPSIGTLIVIAAALGVTMSDIFGEQHGEQDSPLLRVGDQDCVELAPGVVRRIVVRDLLRHMELGETTYAPGAASGPKRRHHFGYEYATVTTGAVHLEVGHRSYDLKEGDSVHFASTVDHRYLNTSPHPTTVMVVNLLA